MNDRYSLLGTADWNDVLGLWKKNPPSNTTTTHLTNPKTAEISTRTAGPETSISSTTTDIL